MKKYNIEPGDVFGQLTTQHVAIINKHTFWLCLCSCGKTIRLKPSVIATGHTKSCGCRRHNKEIYKKLPSGRSATNKRMLTYKSRASQKGILWNLSDDDFYNTIKCSCFYCGMPPLMKVKNGSSDSVICNGIDRIDNNRGYVINNVLPCCKMCNYMKRKLSQREFLEWSERVYQHSIVNNHQSMDYN